MGLGVEYTPTCIRLVSGSRSTSKQKEQLWLQAPLV